MSGAVKTSVYGNAEHVDTASSIQYFLVTVYFLALKQILFYL